MDATKMQRLVELFDTMADSTLDPSEAVELNSLRKEWDEHQKKLRRECPEGPEVLGRVYGELALSFQHTLEKFKEGFNEAYSRKARDTIEGLSQEVESKDRVIAELKERIKLQEATPGDPPWAWQGDGYDFPESLGNDQKVTMTGSALRQLLKRCGTLYERIGKLRRDDPAHRKGHRVSSLKPLDVLKFVREELDELLESPDDKYEMADVVANIWHYMYMKGWTPQEIEQKAIEKINMRFFPVGTDGHCCELKAVSGFADAELGHKTCVVCGGSEGELTAECCGRMLTELERKLCYEGVMNYHRGRWLIKPHPGGKALDNEVQ